MTLLSEILEFVYVKRIFKINMFIFNLWFGNVLNENVLKSIE
jgi:hypothetical protein